VSHFEKKQYTSTFHFFADVIAGILRIASIHRYLRTKVWVPASVRREPSEVSMCFRLTRFCSTRFCSTRFRSSRANQFQAAFPCRCCLGQSLDLGRLLLHPSDQHPSHTERPVPVSIGTLPFSILVHTFHRSRLRGREKHVHSKEGSTGHLYKCPCASASV